ncbi:hypothetical protein B0I35DRAFT_512725 [Stachybotrys elegans]|uniref:DUF6594 domain-containing protein n=1 Tax=Stachybotrys elegans TaxID=80388 RepID=A0A8K0SMM4_9HYPO|nr:hypothetical protein B0I35DRAFT_512725 [Stachybotrys elegans]
MPDTPAMNEEVNDLERGQSTQQPSTGAGMSFDEGVAALRSGIPDLGFIYLNPDESPTQRECSVRSAIENEDGPPGYPRIAASLQYSPDYQHFRVFENLHLRQLLQMQADLQAAELQLVELDKEDYEKDPDICRSRAKAIGNSKARALLEDTRPLLKEYTAMMETYARLMARPRVNEANVQDFADTQILCEWLPDEDMYNYDVYDLKCLRRANEPLLDTWAANLFERHGWILAQWWDMPKRIGNSAVEAYSKPRFMPAVRAFLLVVSVLMLAAPLYPLYVWSKAGGDKNMGAMMATILVSSIVMALMISVCTVAKRHEIIVACAAYMAVLVVFIGTQ